jgi:hypothetical protein
MIRDNGQPGKLGICLHKLSVKQRLRAPQSALGRSSRRELACFSSASVDYPMQEAPTS